MFRLGSSAILNSLADVGLAVPTLPSRQSSAQASSLTITRLRTSTLSGLRLRLDASAAPPPRYIILGFARMMRPPTPAMVLQTARSSP